MFTDNGRSKEYTSYLLTCSISVKKRLNLTKVHYVSDHSLGISSAKLDKWKCIAPFPQLMSTWKWDTTQWLQTKIGFRTPSAKKRYHTGGGHNESRKYSIIVNIWHWTWEKIGYSFTHLWLCRSNQKTTWAIKENHQNVSEKCRITNVDGLPAYDSYGPYCSYSTSAENNWQTYQFGTTLYLQKIKRHMRPKIIQEKASPLRQ